MSEPGPPGEWPRGWTHLPPLTQLQRLVLELRYGFKGIPYTCEEIGEALNISKQGVSRIEQRALARIRRGLGVDETTTG